MKRLLYLMFVIQLVFMDKLMAQTEYVVIDNESSNHNDPAPSTYSRQVKYQLKWNGDIGVPAVGSPGPGTYSTNMTIAGWSDGSAAKHHQLNFNEQGLYWRKGAFGSSWESWRQLIVADANGNVGIGIPTPGSQLHLASDYSHSLNITRANGTYGFRIFRNATEGNVYFQIGNTLNNWETKIKIGEGEGVNTKLLLNPNGGNVGIGTTSPDAALTVNGTIHTKEVKVDTQIWPDYIFEPNYKLQSLESVADYIKSNKHLPDVPSAKEVEENGVNLGEMNKILLQKIEELTLYVIEQKDKNQQLSDLVSKLNERIIKLEKSNE